MADTKIIPIGKDFDMQKMVDQLVQMYQRKGFEVQAVQMGEDFLFTFGKDVDGIKKFLGLALGIKVNISINDNALVLNFSDAEWLGKIIALGVGWIACFIPFFIGIYGAFKQSGFPKEIADDIRMIANGATSVG